MNNSQNITSIIEEVLSASTQEDIKSSEEKLSHLITEGQVLEEQLIRIFKTIKDRGIRGNAQSISTVITRIKSGELGKSTRKAEQILLGASIVGAKKAKESIKQFSKGLKHLCEEFNKGWKDGQSSI